MTERLVSKLHVALLSYDEREIRVRKNYLEEQNPAICCVCFHSGEELLRELRQQRSVDIVVLSSQLEDMDGYEFLKRLNSLHNRPLLLLQGDDWYCWVSVKQFSKNDTATACQDWLRSTRLGRGSIKSHVRTVKVLGMGLFAFQERVHLWKGVTH